MIDLEQVRREGDPLTRARATMRALDALKSAELEAARIRKEALDELLASGMTQVAVAQALGVSPGRISQLLRTGPSPERVFFGVGVDTLPVALGAKPEGGKDEGSYALARDDLMAYEALKKMLKTLSLESHHELVLPPGIIDLNREVFVLCGPRLSPLIAQFLASDPWLRFNKDDDGWFLDDLSADKRHRADQDSGGRGDVAYFGRLPRPDGKGYFLYAGGIHAAGHRGVIHYLESNLPTLYKTVRMRRFSMLIQCEWDGSGEITASTLASDIFHHEETA